ncbi:hypothetical protein [Prevotella sp. khp7]|uniref:hypothetical protein n=1 Tax=Prevotella sp. khp7 TaxID=1761885 RepID=UPI000B254AB2|nr:hypothetical protein [Prevotella sp. khp7]
MKNILQSGLALGIPTQHCSCTNMDFNWIFSNPTNFLWVDNVIVTESMWSIITGTDALGFVEKSKQDSFSKTVRLIYSILNDVGIVKVISDKSITQEEGDNLYNKILDDIELLGDSVKEQGSRMKIGKYCYCPPALWTLYAALYLSRNNNACFMLDQSEMAFLKKVLPLKMDKQVRIASSNTAINEVLSITLPSFELWHHYLADSANKCNLCVNERKCKDEYLSVIEKQVFNLLEYRERDEIKQLCLLMDRICSDRFKEEYEIDPKDLLHEINVEKVKVQRKLNTTYKNIERWKNIVMTISAGLAMGGFFGNGTLSAIGGMGLLATNVLGANISQVEKKHRWVNLFNK